MTKQTIISAKNLCKSFTNGTVNTHVLKNICLDIYKGDFTIIMGSSGSGKSTLLYSLSTMDAPTGGTVSLNGHTLVPQDKKPSPAQRKELEEIRSREISYVFQNILSNSIKYARTEAPEIKVNVSRLDEDFALVEISDNGNGVPPEDVPLVFHRFFRSEKARTQNVPGNGLGLSIVKNIIEKHGGFVDCESTYQKSFTIIFSLPLA